MGLYIVEGTEKRPNGIELGVDRLIVARSTGVALAKVQGEIESRGNTSATLHVYCAGPILPGDFVVVPFGKGTQIARVESVSRDSSHVLAKRWSRHSRSYGKLRKVYIRSIVRFAGPVECAAACAPPFGPDA